MHNILKEKTNVKKSIKKSPKKKRSKNDKMSVLEYLKDVMAHTKDYDLKYDLEKCVQIIEGKENQEVVELKNALEEAIIENETLLQEKTELVMELESIKEEKS